MFAVISTTNARHNAIAINWPSIACVGNYRDSISRKKYESCIKYVSRFQNIEIPWPTEDQILITCYSNDERCRYLETSQVDAVLYSDS